MASVSGRIALKYSLSLMGWILIIGVLGAGISGVGFVLAGGGFGVVGRLLGGLAVFTGGLIIIAGLMGMLYKVIADATAKGSGF